MSREVSRCDFRTFELGKENAFGDAKVPAPFELKRFDTPKKP
jgi:hypothetical protein